MEINSMYNLCSYCPVLLSAFLVTGKRLLGVKLK